jgi:hypothetical protein
LSTGSFKKIFEEFNPQIFVMQLKSISLLLLSAILLSEQPCFSFENSASDLLKRALYFANFYNWRAATPLFQQSEQLAQQAGDRRTALYAHLGMLRRDVSSSIAERSQQVADLLSTDPLLGVDTDTSSICPYHQRRP